MDIDRRILRMRQLCLEADVVPKELHLGPQEVVDFKAYYNDKYTCFNPHIGMSWMGMTIHIKWDAGITVKGQPQQGLVAFEEPNGGKQ